MNRLVEGEILRWKNSLRRKPLIIRGARQVGKTWLVENYLANEFESYIKIDLEKRKDLHQYFDGNLDPKLILSYIELEVGSITPGKTLLFLDEIQACPRAIMALRYFYEELPELHLVSAGSLLEFAFGDISIPVGRVQYLYMYPMTFYEYLLAINRETMAKFLLRSPETIPEKIQKRLLIELKNYFFVGGMPECVKTYASTGSLTKTFAVQSEILDSYRDDFSKYKPSMNTECLDKVFLNIGTSVGEQLKYSKLDRGNSSQMNKKAVDLLSKARIITKIPSCDPSGLPLGATANHKKFKGAMLDIGLMQQLCQIPTNIEIKEDNLLAIYRGKLAEQFIAQEIIAKTNSKIFYWAREERGSSAEIDYLVVKDNQIYPVEVKSGASGSLKSLHMILEKYKNCPKGLVLYSGVYKELEEQKLLFMPLYAISYFVN